MAENEYKAVLKHVRISSQKVRMLTGALKNKPVELAVQKLKFMPQKAAGIVGKIIRSAAANAENNFNMDIDSLYIKSIMVDQGPTLKRFRARARGRGTRILKRTSHITVVLSEGSA